MSDQSILKDLNIGTIITGRISEVHVKNMEQYPFIFLDDVEEFRIDYDIITDATNATPGKKSTVSYTVKFKSGNPPGTLREGAGNLQKALSVLFQTEINLIIRDQNSQVLVGKDE